MGGTRASGGRFFAGAGPTGGTAAVFIAADTAPVKQVLGPPPTVHATPAAIILATDSLRLSIRCGMADHRLLCLLGPVPLDECRSPLASV